MADDKLAHAPPAAAVHYQLSRSESYVINVADMTAVAAQAQVETARMTYAVPAQEATKRTLSESRRFWLVGAVVLVGIFATCTFPQVAGSITTMVCVLGGGIALPSILEKVRKP